MKKKCYIVLFASLVLLLSACGGTKKENGTISKVVTIAMPSVWDSLMPLNTTSAYSDGIFELIYDRLLVIRHNGTYEPRLAEDWEVSDNNDKITFYIDKNAKWHDGTPVTAHDVVWTFQIVAHPDAQHIRRSKAAYFAGTDDSGACLPEDLQVYALDDKTVEFNLKSSMDPETIYAIINRDVFILPKHVLEDIPVDTLHIDPYWNKPSVGSGPFKFSNMISGERMEFVVNEDYHIKVPDFDRLVVRIVQSTNYLSGLMNKDIDIIFGGGTTSIPLNDWELTQQQKHLETKSIPGFGFQFMTINTTKPYLNQEVRQAINLAINRDMIVNQLLKGEGESAIGPYSQSNKYFNQDMLPIEYDVDMALDKVKKSGVEFPDELTLLVPKGNIIRELSAPLLQQDLSKLGINVRIQTLDFPTMLSMVRNGEYDFALIGIAGSMDPSTMVPNVSFGHPNNFSLIQDSTLKEIGEEGVRNVSFETRKPVYDDFQMTLKEQVPFVFLYYPNSLFAYNSRISNVSVEDLFANTCIWEWEVD